MNGSTTAGAKLERANVDELKDRKASLEKAIAELDYIRAIKILKTL